MRFYTIALYLFIFNLLMGVINGYLDIAIPSWSLNQTFTYLGDSATAVQQGAEYGDAISMGQKFISAMSGALILPGHFLNTFGFTWASPIATALIWFIYLVGLYQYFSNRGLKQFE